MKKMIRKLGLLLLVLLCLTVTAALSSCSYGEGDAPVGSSADDTQNGQTPVAPIDSFLLFDGERYTAKIVYNTDSFADMTSLRGKISKAMKTRFGSNPVMEKDTESESNSQVMEILLGNTNRPESQMKDFSEHDAWFYVGITGNKLVINGSNGYMLEQAVEYFLTAYLEGTTGNFFGKELNKQTLIADYTSKDWPMEQLPYYKGERPRYAEAVYNSGKMITNLKDASAEEAKVMLISQTTRSEFNNYVERLKTFGYSEVSSDTLESGANANRYVTLTDGTNQVYAYYVNSKHVATVVLDNASATAKDVSFTSDPGANGRVEFYQYGLNMDPNALHTESVAYPDSGLSGYKNNGMMYIIKCADNSLILVDGGNLEQMVGIAGEPEAPMVELNRFLHEITGVAEGEKINIACWFLTHAHSDHFGGFTAFLQAYHAQYDLRAVCANVSYLLGGTSLEGTSNTINQYYPACKEIKIHTGQKLEFAGVTMQALYTHEDCVGLNSGVSQLINKDFNNTSTVVKFATDGMDMLILGDSASYTQEYLIKAYTTETLGCDIVQVAHHAFTDLSILYDIMKARIVFFPQSYGTFQYRVEQWEITNKNAIEKSIYKYADPDMIFFSGKFAYTVGLAVQDGQICVIREPEKLTTSPQNPDLDPESGIVITDDREYQWGDLFLISA